LYNKYIFYYLEMKLWLHYSAFHNYMEFCMKKKLYVFICTSLVDTPEDLNDQVVEVSREHKCFNAK